MVVVSMFLTLTKGIMVLFMYVYMCSSIFTAPIEIKETTTGLLQRMKATSGCGMLVYQQAYVKATKGTKHSNWTVLI